jgi:hypothetical protein
MNDVLTTLASLVAAGGLGGVIGAYFQARFQHRATLGKEQHELKQRRYLCILILMLCKLNPKVGLPKVKAIRPDLGEASDIDEELRTELMNGLVFASDAALLSLRRFIDAPSENTFIEAAVAMRHDLWGRGSRISAESLRGFPIGSQ